MRFNADTVPNADQDQFYGQNAHQTADPCRNRQELTVAAAALIERRRRRSGDCETSAFPEPPHQMNWQALLDPLSAAIVLGGTLIAAVMRCGPRDVVFAFTQLARSLRGSFRFDEARADLAAQVAAIRAEGILRAPPSRSNDAEALDIMDALVRNRSASALVAKHRSHQSARRASTARAVDAFVTCGDLAPIFGLAGTLFALSQMPALQSGEGLEAGALMATVAMAVVTTLYGLLAAHLLFYPLGRLIERHGQREDTGRQQLVHWLQDQVEAGRAHTRRAPASGRVNAANRRGAA